MNTILSESKKMQSTYNFDCVIDRSGTGAIKLVGLDRVFGRHDLTPLWIADLDFAVCPEITKALQHRLQHPVLGYSEPNDSYWQSIINWELHRHNFALSREELCFIPGVVKGIALCVNFFTEKDDAVVIMPPVYTPFRTVIEGNKRRVVENPLRFENGNYSIDLENLEHVVENRKAQTAHTLQPSQPYRSAVGCRDSLPPWPLSVAEAE